MSAKLSTLTHLKRYVNKKTLLLVYKTAILPIVEYANLTHSLLTKKLNNKLQRLQNRALSIIYFNYYQPLQERETMEELHQIAKLAPIKQRAEKQLLCLMFRWSFNETKYPQIMGINENRITRASRKIRFDVPRPKTERYKQFPHYRGAQIWEALTYSTQVAPTYEAFKRPITKAPNFEAYPVR